MEFIKYTSGVDDQCLLQARPLIQLCRIVSFMTTSLAVYGKIDFIIMQLCDWALPAIMLAEIINAPISEFPLSWLQQVQE